jgi:colicin import membrane protein
MTFRLPHLIAAFALHVVVLGLLLGGVQCSAKPRHAPVITAVLLDPSREQAADRKREEQRRAAEDRKRREDEARRLAEQKKRADAEARKKQEAEALRQKQLADKKAADKRAADKKLADQKAAEQKTAEQKKKAADEAARKKEQERLDREAAAQRDAAEQQRVEQAMQKEAEQREAELAAEALANDQRIAQGLEWGRALEAHIKKRYSLPPNTQSQLCRVQMQLLPDGTVQSAKVISSCGSPFVDQAVIDAVYKSSPMPLPADRAVFDPELTINFKP